MSKLIVGCGYLGSRVAQLWKNHGDQVTVVTRSTEHAQKFAQQGLSAVQADVTNQASLQALASFESINTVLFAVGYDRNTSNTISEVYAEGFKNVLEALPTSVTSVIYISTTGVYGPADGEWVDEATPPNPQRAGGKASLAAEQHLSNHPLGKRSAILRLGGIYGPDRIPYQAKLLAGESIAAPSKGWLNLIHVDDAARIVLAVEQWLESQTQVNHPQIFCVTDGQPVVRANYYREVARLIDAPEPSFSEPDPSTPAAARARSDKRVSNDRLTSTIQQPFVFPNYQAGLAAILKSSSNR